MASLLCSGRIVSMNHITDVITIPFITTFTISTSILIIVSVTITISIIIIITLTNMGIAETVQTRLSCRNLPPGLC